MEPNKIKVTLHSNDNIISYELVATIDKEKNLISYQENDSLKTKVTLNLNERTLIRDNEEYTLNYHFLEDFKESNNQIYLKKNNSSVYIKLKTLKYKVTENTIEIHYEIVDSNEKINYIINY